jgi:hypothetical protein
MIKLESTPPPDPLQPIAEPQMPLPDFHRTIGIYVEATQVQPFPDETDESVNQRRELAKNCFKLVATIGDVVVETRNVRRDTPLDELIPGLMFDVGQALLGVKSGPTVVIEA